MGPSDVDEEEEEPSDRAEDDEGSLAPSADDEAGDASLAPSVDFAREPALALPRSFLAQPDPL